jgi:integrase
LNAELHRFWEGLATDIASASLGNYEQARARARSLGFDYVENADLLTKVMEERLTRLEALATRSIVDDPIARAALLGTEKRPELRLSGLFEEYETLTRDERIGLSPDQLRIWRNSRIRVVDCLVSVVGDKPVTAITEDDGVRYTEWWRERVLKKGLAAKTANREIGQLSAMFKELSRRHRLKLPDIFHDLRLRGEKNKSRHPFETAFIQDKLLATGALADMNEEARRIFYVIVETGLRPSEVANLQESAICLDAPIPHVKIRPDGRMLKTEDSERDIPLVGVALAAMQMHPRGFPRYRDNSSSLSGALNKFLQSKGLRPTKSHTVYPLRHSFKDRLVAAEAPDSLIDNLMGHKTYKPKYGKGPDLELKLKYLKKIALRTPDRV